MRRFLCSFPQPYFILWYTLCTVCQCHCHLQADGLLTAILPRVAIEFSQQEPSLLTHTTINSEIAGGQNACCCKLIFKARSFRSHLPGSSRGIYHWNIIISATTSLNQHQTFPSLKKHHLILTQPLRTETNEKQKPHRMFAQVQSIWFSIE